MSAGSAGMGSMIPRRRLTVRNRQRAERRAHAISHIIDDAALVLAEGDPELAKSYAHVILTRVIDNHTEKYLS